MLLCKCINFLICLPSLSNKRLNRVVVVSCLDNIIKGAAGQAVQNLNIMFGLPENTGIDMPAFYL